MLGDVELEEAVEGVIWGGHACWQILRWELQIEPPSVYAFSMIEGFTIVVRGLGLCGIVTSAAHCSAIV